MQDKYEKYFSELPEQVSEAVEQVNVQEKLRALAKKYQLHLDKWELLEDEIILTLVGAKDVKKMPANISNAIGVDLETAQHMIDDIAINIFKPIRLHLQDELNNKKERAVAALTGTDVQSPEPPSQSYHDTSLTSSSRKEIHNDPYREQID